MLATSPSSELQFQNDIYAKVCKTSLTCSQSVSPSCSSLPLCHLQYASMVAPEQATITVDTIYPATEKHVSKHSTQKFVMVSMTLYTYHF